MFNLERLRFFSIALTLIGTPSSSLAQNSNSNPDIKCISTSMLFEEINRTGQNIILRGFGRAPNEKSKNEIIITVGGKKGSGFFFVADQKKCSKEDLFYRLGKVSNHVTILNSSNYNLDMNLFPESKIGLAALRARIRSLKEAQWMRSDIDNGHGLVNSGIRWQEVYDYISDESTFEEHISNNMRKYGMDRQQAIEARIVAFQMAGLIKQLKNGFLDDWRTNFNWGIWDKYQVESEYYEHNWSITTIRGAGFNEYVRASFQETKPSDQSTLFISVDISKYRPNADIRSIVWTASNDGLAKLRYRIDASFNLIAAR